MKYNLWKLYIGLAVVIVVCMGMHFMRTMRLKNLSVGGNKYSVLPDDSADGARTLYNIESKLRQLVDHMLDAYPYNPKLRRLHSRLRETRFIESGHATYTQDKGHSITLCIRNAAGDVFDSNTLLFVAIHELSHIFCSSIGHTPEFWRGFKFILTEAVKINMYTPVNYSEAPQEYCGGKKITDSPLFGGDASGLS